jgi:hypothetical protein
VKASSHVRTDAQKRHTEKVKRERGERVPLTMRHHVTHRCCLRNRKMGDDRVSNAWQVVLIMNCSSSMDLSTSISAGCASGRSCTAGHKKNKKTASHRQLRKKKRAQPKRNQHTHSFSSLLLCFATFSLFQFLYASCICSFQVVRFLGHCVLYLSGCASS